MRTSLSRICISRSRRAAGLAGAFLAVACAGPVRAPAGRDGSAGGPAAPRATAVAGAPADASPTPAARVERRVGLMGTTLVLAVEASDRATALAASEAAVRALEAAERRLSTWTDASELARLNAAPVGAPVTLSAELAAELDAARRWHAATGGAFDPAVGGLVRAWDLRGAGRVPAAAEVDAARVPAGLAALALDGRTATRRDARLVLEEGGFGKGAGLDAALAALRTAGATSGVLDLGGQVALLAADPPAPLALAVAHPLDRAHVVARLSIADGSLATTGDSERGLVVDGARVSHVLDPRTGRPVAVRGSVTVWARGPGAATAADCLSTGLYVLGPDAALAWAAEHDGVEVLVCELVHGGVRLRASAGLADRLTAVPGTADAP